MKTRERRRTINTINPQGWYEDFDAWMDIELRAEQYEELKRLRRTKMITFDYVRSDKGDYGIQVWDEMGYFCILTEDLEYPQGIGWATEWTIVDPEEIPEEIRKELELAIDGYLDYLAFRDSQDNPAL